MSPRPRIAQTTPFRGPWFTRRHCVATYARSCARGLCSIWALEVESFEGRSKVLTVEVHQATRLICQARGKCNALPTDSLSGAHGRAAQANQGCCVPSTSADDDAHVESGRRLLRTV